jgi:VWFA-related protein
MNRFYRAGLSLFCLLGVSLSTSSARSQQPLGPPAASEQMQQPAAPLEARDRLVLDVVVTDRSGKVISGLQQKDFVVLDNKQPQQILSFHASVEAAAQPEPPVKVILVVDEVNTTINRVAYERNEIKKVLQQNGGKLPFPTSIAFFTDTKTEILSDTTQDGNSLLQSFDKQESTLRELRRSTGFYGAVERFQLSLGTLNQLAAAEAREPGRKIIVWISPGWPILSGPQIDLTSKEAQGIYNSIVSVTNSLRQSRITLYSVDPLGIADAGGLRVNYYQEFLKPITAAKNSQVGNLALQVIAVHSGGLALNSSNDITAQITRCVADASAFYTLTLEAAPGEPTNNYHAIDVKVENPGLTARTRSGYYAIP